MRITISTIAEELAQTYNNVHLHRESLCELDSVRIYRSGVTFESNMLYICQPNNIMGPLPQNSCFVCLGSPNQFFAEDISFIVVDDPVSEWDLLDTLSVFFKWVGDWQRNMMQAVINNCSVQTLVDFSLNMFDGQINVYNGLNALIATRNDVEVTHPMRWKNLLEHTYMNTDAVSQALGSSTFDRTMTVKHAELFAPPSLGHRFITINAWMGKYRLANITIAEGKTKFRTIHLILLDEMIKYVSAVMQRESVVLQTQGTEASSFLLDAINGYSFAQAEIDHHLSLLNWKSSDTYILAVILSKVDSDDSDDSLLHYWHSFIELFLSAKVFIYNHAIVLLVNVTRSAPLFDERFHLLSQTLSNSSSLLYGGCSMQFHDFSLIGSHYQQALYASAVAYQHTKTHSFVKYENHIADHLIDTFSIEQNLEAFLHTAVKRLIEMQDSFSFDLLETLLYWLISGKRNNICASKLFIHNNTLQYRIGKLLPLLTDWDLDDPETAMNIIISIKMYYKMHKKEK